MLVRRFILRQNTGTVICKFAERMGVVYIKMAQILAMQNCGDIFTESDRECLAKICDHCQPISYAKIRQILVQEYGDELSNIFLSIDEHPLGSASISQVHRATLADGREVVIKVKRRDITRRVDHDVKQLKRLIHRFGRFASLRNLLGSDRALLLWADWIHQETDFQSEHDNILRYQSFAEDVNGRVARTISLKVPRVYSEYCTENIIVMEYIPHPTVSQLELTPEHKQRVQKALNDYLSLSFYALFHGRPVVFHGDPHSGNIYLDEAGNLGFLDLGLIFELTPAEADFVRELFLSSYTGKPEKIVDFLIKHSEHTAVDRVAFAEAIRAEVQKVRDIPVTAYFVEMMLIFTQFDMSPPVVFFKMAKAFLALFGINTFIDNDTSTQSLLATQLAEYYITRTADDFRTLTEAGIKLLPNFLTRSLRQGISHSIVGGIEDLSDLHRRATRALENCGEVIDLIRAQR